MKFAKVFEQALKEEGLPEEWLNSAIQYKALKKCINNVVKELDKIGLERETLSILFQEGSTHGAEEGAFATYALEKVSNDVNPRLIIEIKRNASSTDVNKSVSEVVGKSLDRIISQFSNQAEDSLVMEPRIVEVVDGGTSGTTRLEFNMSADSFFFHTLYQELKDLDDLKQGQERKMIGELDKVGDTVSKYGNPSTRRSDIYTWREIFKDYIDSEIFFSTSEFRPGEHDPNEARIRLSLFLKRMTDQEMIKKFHHKKSVEAFNTFYNVNLELLKALQFQIYNKLAVTKILKKFDKQTSLKAQSKFPGLIANDPFINASFAHTICAIISSRLLNVIPQLDDYTCPICCSVQFKPIRLDCGHVFCVRCLVKMQRKNQDHCPLCRADVVMNADEHNLDLARLEYLKMYFPRETKAKQAETEKEIAKEQFEAVYGPHQKCCIQ